MLLDLDPNKFSDYGSGPEHQLLDRPVRNIAKQFVSAGFPKEYFSAASSIDELTTRLGADHGKQLLNGHFGMVNDNLETDQVGYFDYEPVVVLARKQLGLSPKTKIPLDSFELSDESIQSIGDRMRAQVAVFEVLEDIHKRPQMRDHVLPLLREFSELLERNDIQGIFDRIKQCIGDPNLTIAPDDYELLYFLLFLDRDLRFAVQELMMYNTVIDFLNKKKTEYAGDPDTLKLIGDIIEHYKMDLTSHYHLKELAGRDPAISSSVASDLIEFNRIKGELDFSIASRLKGKDGIRIYHDIRAFWSDVLRSIQRSQERGGSDYFEQTDPGHAVKYGGELKWMVEVLSSVANVKKDGRVAVILEDSGSDSEYFQRLVTDRSPYSLPSGEDSKGVCSKAQDFEPWIENEGVAVYILDQDNHGDSEAGMRIAERILRFRQQKYQDFLANGGDPFKNSQRVDIRMVSSSNKLLKKAEEYLRGIFGDDHNVSKINGLSGVSSSSLNKINIHFSHKSEFGQFQLAR